MTDEPTAPGEGTPGDLPTTATASPSAPSTANHRGMVATLVVLALVIVAAVVGAVLVSSGPERPDDTVGIPGTEDGPDMEDGPDTGDGGDATDRLPQAADGQDVTITVGRDCYEIYLTLDDALYRSRDFPTSWQPGSEHTGVATVVVPATESEAGVVEVVTNDGTATFSGGPGAVFTMDCPAPPGT